MTPSISKITVFLIALTIILVASISAYGQYTRPSAKVILFHRRSTGGNTQLILQDLNQNIAFTLADQVGNYVIAPNREFVLYNEAPAPRTLLQESVDNQPARCGWNTTSNTRNQANFLAEQCYAYTTIDSTQVLFIIKEGHVWNFYHYQANGKLNHQWSLENDALEQRSVWSPNGKSLFTAFENNRTNGYTVYHTNLQTYTTTQIDSDFGVINRYFAPNLWSPDGEYGMLYDRTALAETSLHFVDSSGSARLFMAITGFREPAIRWFSDSQRFLLHDLQADGSAYVGMVHASDLKIEYYTDTPVRVRNQELSDDEEWLTISYRNAEGKVVLELVNVLQGSQQILAETAHEIYSEFLPDGHSLFVQTDEAVMVFELASQSTSMLMQLDTRKNTPFSPSPNPSIQVAIRIDQEQRYVTCPWVLEILDYERGNMQRVEGPSGCISDFQWLPDGQQIVLQSRSDPDHQFVYSVTEQKLFLLNDLHEFVFGQYSDNQQQVIFSQRLPFTRWRNVFLLDMETRSLRQITRTDASESEPVWVH